MAEHLEVVSAVLAAAQFVTEMVQQVRGNRAQCATLKRRVETIVAPVEQLEAAKLARKETQLALWRLTDVLRECGKALGRFASEELWREILSKGARTDTLADLNTQLGDAAQALALGLNIQQLFDPKQDQEDEKKDTADRQAQLQAIQAGVAAVHDDAKDFKAGMAQTVAASAHAPSGRIWAVPAVAVARFVGRADALSQLSTLLVPAGVRQRAPHVVIIGMGGTGKSSLAYKAAEQASGRFKTGWAVDGSSKETLLNGLQAVAAGLGISDVKPADVGAVVRTALSRDENAGWLVLVDNVDTAEVAALLPSHVPDVGGCVLVTSRRSNWSNDAWTKIELSPMPVAEAVEVLAAPDDPAALQVADRVGGLPLALAQAQAYVDMAQITWAVYLERLDESLRAMSTRGGAAVANAGNGGAETQLSVLASLQLSLKAALGTHPRCGTMLELLQIVHPEQIPRSLLQQAFIRLTGATAAGADKVLTVLAEQSIIRLAATDVSTHRLMQTAMRLIEPCPKEAATALTALMDAQVDAKDEEDFPLMRLLLVHYAEAIAWMERQCASSVELASALRSCGNIQWYSFGQPKEAKDFFARALAMYERIYGPDHLEVAKTVRRLGLAFQSLGDYTQQRVLEERAVAFHEAQAAGGRPVDYVEYAAALRNLGNAHANLGDYAQQKTFAERSLALQEQHGSDASENGATLQSLAGAYGSLGDYVKQKELVERVLELYTQRYGADHVKTMVAVESLAGASGSMGEYTKEKELAERVLAMYEKHYGTGHIYVAGALQGLANAYSLLGEYAKQKELMERVLSMYEDYYGADHVKVAAALYYLADAHGSLGDYAKKKELVERTLAIEQSFYRSDHIQIAITTIALANVYGLLGDYARKKELLERVLAMYEKHYGADHVDVAAALHGLADAYGLLGEYAKEKELMERVLSMYEECYGADHIKVATALAGLAIAHDKLGDYGTQKTLMERVLRVNERYYGADHVEVADSLWVLANAYHSLGDYTKAKDLMTRVLVVYEKHYGAGHVQVARALLVLANACGSLGDCAKQKELMERILPILETFYGPNSPEVATAVNNLAVAHGWLRDNATKVVLLQRALGVYEQYYGAEHVETSRALLNLGVANKALGNDDVARTQLERALKIRQAAYGVDHEAVKQARAALDWKPKRQPPAGLATSKSDLSVQQHCNACSAAGPSRASDQTPQAGKHDAACQRRHGHGNKRVPDRASNSAGGMTGSAPDYEARSVGRGGQSTNFKLTLTGNRTCAIL